MQGKKTYRYLFRRNCLDENNCHHWLGCAKLAKLFNTVVHTSIAMQFSQSLLKETCVLVQFVAGDLVLK